MSLLRSRARPLQRLGLAARTQNNTFNGERAQYDSNYLLEDDFSWEDAFRYALAEVCVVS
ncbi:hypothetical protein F443_23146 [Phytophthora nicotianae P1569]|uniref:Uncharacterized protein n=1 Tax=Phytophthora nicotianae P1569 TaxID=1317065 RepID=V9DS62_PHYNI|nr:hypothetical protein F443_23146 [Phytophthora nicotianae P1569]